MPEYSWNVIVETFRVNDITQGYQEAPEILQFNNEIRYFWSNSDFNTGRLEWRYSNFNLETQELEGSISLDVDGVLSSGFGNQGQFEAAVTQGYELLTVWAAFSYSGRSITVSQMNNVNNDISSSILTKLEDEQFGSTVDLLVADDNRAYFTYFTYSEDNGTELKIGEIDANTSNFISSGSTVSSIGNSGFPVELFSLEQNGNLSFLYAASDGSERGIFLTRYDPIANDLLSNIRVNQDTFLDQAQPRYAELASGATIISWRSFGEAGFPENGIIKGQMIDPSGGVIGGNFNLITDERIINRVNSYEIFNLGEDKFGIAAITGSRIFLEIFDYQGNSLSAFDDISDGYPSFISDLSAMVVEENKIVLAWSAENRDGSNFGIFSQVIELEENEADQITNGTPASESLIGNAGNDMLHGESGNDTLTGNAGNDFLDGGSGQDTAVYSGNQNSYSLTLSPSSVLIADRRGDGNGTDTLVDVEFLDFDTDLLGSPFDLTNFGGTTSLSSSDFESFIELYIAYFNRSPDAVGLNFWGTAFANGTTLEQMATLFVDQDETQATYPDGTSNTDFVTAVYDNVLGRIPDQDGFDFWIDMLNRSEDTGVTRDQFILDVLRGVQGGSADRAYLDSKVDIGAYFAVHRGMSDVDNASAAMALFDGSQASIDDAVAAIDGYYQDALDPTNGEFLMQVVGVLDNPFIA